MSRLETSFLFVLSLFYAPSIGAKSGDCLVVTATVPEKAPSFTLVSSGQPSCNTISIDGDTYIRLDQDTIARCSTSYVIDIYICAAGSCEIDDVQPTSGVRIAYTGGGLRFYIDFSGYQEVRTIASWVVHPKTPDVRGTVTLSVAGV